MEAEPAAETCLECDEGPRWAPPPEPGGERRPASAEDATWREGAWALPEAEWRELYYAHGGDFTRCVLEPGAPWWLGAMHRRAPLAAAEVTVEDLVGENTFIHCSLAHLERVWPLALEACRRGRGTRVMVVLPRSTAESRSWESRARSAGMVEVRAMETLSAACSGVDGLGRAGIEGGYTAYRLGRPAYAPSGMTLDHVVAEAYLDPKDRGEGCEDKLLKSQRSYGYIPHDPARWRGKGFSPYVESTMTEGHRIEGELPDGFYEVDQYRWRDRDAQRVGGLEADRHVLAGALEYVPEREAGSLLSSRATVHPWTVVFQKDKWRACQDFSGGTNLEADSAPFRLPSVFDVKAVVKPTTHFSKWDLRDGFFHIPIHPGSRNRMLVRHPISGRLMRCLRLPFGYVDSPRAFCAVTEAVAQKFRERAAAAGVRAHIFVFVDDALVAGDTLEDTREAGRILEALFAELGLQWAPHKRRGPAQVIEFLGMLLCNAPEGPRCIGLTRARQESLVARLAEWAAREPAPGGGPLVLDNPRELAVLLGHLVFASSVVPRGRTYMQGMLASFSGLEVEWRRGKVRIPEGQWKSMEIKPGFWADIDWWLTQMTSSNCVPMEKARTAAAAVQAGTDASDFGAGELIFLHGQREETRMKFTSAEKRRPINWRELLGILRVVEVWGERLRGERLLIETDNTVAWATGSKGHSKAPEMQELLRRLCEGCARNAIDLSLTHQPGLKLDRPDQISRGSPMEEPRVRLRAEAYAPLAERFGPFTEFLGAEREHRTARPLDGAVARLFVHPAYTTVGSALRTVGERLQEAIGGTVRGLMVVPYAPTALWWRLLRHFAVVAHLRDDPAHPHLEANALGSWRPMAARRESLILAFPRSSGFSAMPVHVDLLDRSPSEPGYRLVPESPSFAVPDEDGEEMLGGRHRFVLTLPKGSFVYSLPAREGDFGALYYLSGTYRPTTEEEAFGPECLYVLLDGRVGAGKACPGKRPVLIDSKASYSWTGKERGPYQPDGDDLYVVTHLVERTAVPVTKARGWASVTDYFFFDEAAALTQIAARTQRKEGARAPADAWDHLTASDLGESMVEAMSVEEPPSEAAAGPSAATSAEDGEPQWLRTAASELERGGESAHAPPPEPRPVSAGPASGRMCGLPGCTRPCFIEPDGRVHDFCGRTHALAAAPQGPASARQCGLPGCTRPCFVEPDGRVHDFCCRAHSKAVAIPVGDGGAAAEAAGQWRQPTDGGMRDRYAPARTESGEGTIQIARSDGILCAGCFKPARSGSKIEVFGASFIHPLDGCRLKAKARLAAEEHRAKSQVEGQTSAMAGSLQKQAKMRERFDDRRMLLLRTCMAGCCELAAKPIPEQGTVMMCREGCGVSLHAACAQIAKGNAVKANFVCTACRLKKMGAEGQPHESLKNEVTALALVELTLGRETTAATHDAFVRLTEQWVASRKEAGISKILSPVDSLESFKQFAAWMVLKADRARSLTTTMRAAGAYFAATGRQNFTLDKAVKKLLTELDDLHGTESQPMTHGTRRMLQAIIFDILPKQYSAKPRILEREKVTTVNESVGCLRACESLGAVESHGLAANDCFILKEVATGEVSVEVKLHDSKTKFERWINMSAVTEVSKIPVADCYMNLFKGSGVTLARGVEGGFEFIQPDSWSVKLSLLAVPSDFAAKLNAVLWVEEKSGWDPGYSKIRARMVKYATDAYSATTGGEAHKYVLLNEGPRAWVRHEKLMKNLEAAGLGAIGKTINLVPTPLLRSTTNSGADLTPMPYTYSAAYSIQKAVFEKAYTAANPHGDPDPEFDLQGHEEPRWGKHSWRRFGEKVARDSEHIHKTPPAQQDLYCGWNQKEHDHNMQLHYAGMQRSFRVKRIHITRQI